MKLRLTLAAAVAALAVAPASAGAIGWVPEDATWTEATIPSSGGVQLHADVLRPKGLARGERVPVILSIGPYFNHSGQTGPAGPVEGTDFDPVGPSSGPSERFRDFVEGSGLMKKGYAFMMVDLRGFGGSTGCLDWAGPGERADVVRAVNWAASRSWSTGKVGMYGKSYDAMTGLIGVDLRPAGLAAVVAQEPVYDPYRYLYGEGIRRLNSIATPALYDAIAGTPGPLGDAGAADYNAGAVLENADRPGCLLGNFLDQAMNDDHASSFWRERSLIPGARGSSVPLFLTQGLTENNTVGDGMAQYLQNHTGPERGWLGPWEHVRGNETDEDGRLKMGRKGWFDEVLAFYDQHLKGAPAKPAPTWAIQTNDGVWRSETSWPPADATRLASPLRSGTYTDDGTANATGSGAEQGIWTVSPPLAQAAHLAGSGMVYLDTEAALPRGNLVVDVYDLDASGTGPLITRGAKLLRENGRQAVELWSADWILRPGHRLGIKVADSNADWWVHVPTKQTIAVRNASVTLPFKTVARKEVVQGDPGTQLEGYLGETVTVPAATIAAAERSSLTPPAAK